MASQAAAARAEMGIALHQLVGEIGTQLSPRRLIRRHPWTSLAAAAGAGAGLGYTVSARRARPAQQAPFPIQSQPITGEQQPKIRRFGLARLILLPLFASLGQAAKVALDRFLIGLVESALATASVPEDAAQASEELEPEQEVPAVG